MAKSESSQSNRLGIVAGGGAMPVTVAAAAQSAGRPVHIIGIRGFADAAIEAYPHSWVAIGELGKLLKLLNEKECRQIVIVGTVKRPDFTKIKFDLGAIANMAAILSWTVGGDTSMLSGIVGFFESKGHEVIGAHEIAPALLAEPGPLGRYKPGKEDLEDIRTGLAVVRALGKLDVGQAVVVARKYVLAVEAAEGTDRMLERCTGLRPWGARKLKSKRGVLVKSAKPGQDRRIDLPAIGPETLRRAAEAGLAGIAVAAGEVLIADRDALVEQANKAGLFVVGVDAAGETT
jgi:DUF1009 family protein